MANHARTWSPDYFLPTSSGCTRGPRVERAWSIWWRNRTLFWTRGLESPPTRPRNETHGTARLANYTLLGLALASTPGSIQRSLWPRLGWALRADIPASFSCVPALYHHRKRQLLKWVRLVSWRSNERVYSLPYLVPRKVDYGLRATGQQLISKLPHTRFLILGAVGRSKVIFNPSFGSALPRGAPVYVACYMYVLAY